jgi:flagellar biosynthesis GTPase FlhF
MAPEAKLAAIAETPHPVAPPASAPEVYSFEGNPAVTRIATLGGPAVIVDEKAAAEASEKTEAKTTEAKATEVEATEARTADAKATEARPDRAAARKRAAEQAREKRRIAAARRARQAREAVLTLQQQQPNPFIQTPFAQGPVVRATR